MAIRKVTSKTKSGVSVRWKAEVYDPALGKAASVAAYRPDRTGTFKTRNEAKTAFDEATRLIATRAGKATQTVAELKAEWWAEHVSGLKVSTQCFYETGIGPLVEQYPDVAIDAFTDEMAAAWHARRGQTYSTVAGAMFGWALRQRKITANPFRSLKRVQYKRDLKPGFLTLEKVERLVDVAQVIYGDYGKVLGTAITVAAWTCMRPGELFALQMDDLDLVEGSVTIERAAYRRRDGGMVVAKPKSNKPREILLPAAARESILGSREAVAALGGGEQVVCTMRGTMLSTQRLSSAWGRISAAAGYHDLQFYDLRHFGASKMLEMGVREEDVVHQLGHADARILREHYKHVDHSHTHRRMTRAMDEYLARQAKPEAELAVVAAG
jgi:integrase